MQTPESIRRILNWFKREGDPIDVQKLLSNETRFQFSIDDLKEKLRKLENDMEELKVENAALESYLETTAKAIDRDVPSITKQTPWPCGFYNFGEAKKYGYRFFNPANIMRPDGEWLIARRARPMDGTVDGMNDLVAFKIDSATRQPILSYQCKFPKRYNHEHYEDPRVMYLGGEVYLSASTFHRMGKNRWALVHQVLARMGKDWTCSKLYDPIHGFNGGTPLMQTGFEKNWLWFEHEGRFFMVYRNQPHEVVEFDERLKVVKVHKTSFGNPLWQHGEIRGGTPPVRVGNEYFSFFHSSTPWIGKKRRYHMGLYAFEANPPFRITRMSTLPILSGSKDDPWFEGLPLVVFPCGAIFRNGIWTVSLGVNDCESAWIDIPHTEIVQTLRNTVEIEHDIKTVVNPTIRAEAETPESQGSLGPVQGVGPKRGPETVPIGDDDTQVAYL